MSEVEDKLLKEIPGWSIEKLCKNMDEAQKVIAKKNKKSNIN